MSSNNNNCSSPAAVKGKAMNCITHSFVGYIDLHLQALDLLRKRSPTLYQTNVVPKARRLQVRSNMKSLPMTLNKIVAMTPLLMLHTPP